MRNNLCAFLMIATFVSITFSCQQNQELAPPTRKPIDQTATPTPLATASKYLYYSDELSNTNAILGRVLFYDKRLSVDNSISCSSCHKQQFGFGDNLNVSSGAAHLQGVRNAVAIQNLVRPDNPTANIFLFWDGRETDLTQMVADPIVNHIEMGQPDLRTAAQKIYDLRDYKQWINASYKNTRPFDEYTISQALAAFVSVISTTRSLGDGAGDLNIGFTAEQKGGKDLFFNKYNCGSCHRQTPGAVRTEGSPDIYGDGTVTDSNGASNVINFVNIGLDREYTDQGRGALTQNRSDNGRFRIPDLHNVAVTAPYMHDGRFKTLNEVLEHYSSGIADHPNLDPQLRDSVTLQPRKMNITSGERVLLIAFLKTLTDNYTLTDPALSDPFRVN